MQSNSQTNAVPLRYERRLEVVILRNDIAEVVPAERIKAITARVAPDLLTSTGARVYLKIIRGDHNLTFYSHGTATSLARHLGEHGGRYWLKVRNPASGEWERDLKEALGYGLFKAGAYERFVEFSASVGDDACKLIGTCANNYVELVLGRSDLAPSATSEIADSRWFVEPNPSRRDLERGLSDLLREKLPPLLRGTAPAEWREGGEHWDDDSPRPQPRKPTALPKRFRPAERRPSVKLPIPSSTQEEIDNPAPLHERHTQIVRIAVPLTARGYSPQEIFDILRPNYDATMTDNEIWGVVHGVAAYPNLNAGRPRDRRWRETVLPRPPSQAQVMDNIGEYLGGFRCAAADLSAASPVPVAGLSPVEQALAFLRAVFSSQDRINIVRTYSLGPDGSVSPGFGETAFRSEWEARIARAQSVPQSKCGAWCRANPLDGKWITNANVVGFLNAVVEFDTIPIPTQLALLAKLDIPIKSIVLSGGKSVHALVDVAAPDADAYAQRVAGLFRRLIPFGIDVGNKNPSRLTRLPGARRILGSVGDGSQTLLFLSPSPDGKPIL